MCYCVKCDVSCSGLFLAVVPVYILLYCEIMLQNTSLFSVMIQEFNRNACLNAQSLTWTEKLVSSVFHTEFFKFLVTTKIKNTQEEIKTNVKSTPSPDWLLKFGCHFELSFCGIVDWLLYDVTRLTCDIWQPYKICSDWWTYIVAKIIFVCFLYISVNVDACMSSDAGRHRSRSPRSHRSHSRSPHRPRSSSPRQRSG